MNWFGKKIQIPDVEKTVEVEVSSEVYSVRWTSRYGEFSSNVKKECEFFRNKEEAEKFRDALIKAFEFIRCERVCDVELITERQNQQ